MKTNKFYEALCIIREEYAIHGHKTSKSIRAVVENKVKRRARNKAINEGLIIYEKRHPGIIFKNIVKKDEIK